MTNEEADLARDRELAFLANEYAYKSDDFNRENWLKFREKVFAIVVKYGAGKNYTKGASENRNS